jgi:nucleoside-diphosphate-sugar epimerase
VPFPPERKRIDIGDFYADTSKVRRVLGWQSTTPLEQGIVNTLAFYAEHKDRYL